MRATIISEHATYHHRDKASIMQSLQVYKLAFLVATDLLLRGCKALRAMRVEPVEFGGYLRPRARELQTHVLSDPVFFGF
jgi:hypothetical protein